MKKTKFGKLALIGAGLYAVKALADKKTEETALNNIFAGLPQNASPETAEIPFSPDEFKKWLDANPAIKAALKGAAGEAGSNGTSGVDGNQVQNFGGSLLVNGALESSFTIPFSNSTAASDSHLGFESISVNAVNAQASCKIYIRKDRLYTIETKYKSSVALNHFVISLRRYNSVNASIGFTYPTIIGTAPIADNFTSFKSIFGGINESDGTSGLNANTAYINLFIAATNFPLIINSLIIRMIDLGEAVPSNLLWIPTGQEVYDTTTGDRGRYNGTAVDWYTMV